LAEEIQS